MSSPPQPEPEADDPPLGEVPDGIVGADLYPKHLEYLSRHDAFQDGVISFPDSEGDDHDVALDQVSDAEDDEGDTSRTKIRLRNGAIVVVSSAVVAGAIAALRYRQKHKDAGS
jgi:hypothetical protein